MNELEKTEEEKNKTLAEIICFTKDIIKHTVSENLKQYVFLVIILEIISVI